MARLTTTSGKQSGRMKGLNLLLCVLMVLALGISSSARTLYVRPDGDDANSGQSWTEAKRTIAAAISSADSGDEIWVARDTYLENLSGEKPLSLYGGFRGDENSVSERPPFPRPDPDPDATVIDAGGSARAIYLVEVSGAVLLDGLCIRNGWADFGGGISGSSQSLTIRNCCFDGCIALYQGGGIAWYGAISPVIVEGCRFTRNGAAAGGAIFGVVAASDTLFMENRANLGGAVYLEYIGGRFTRCRFEGNTGSEGGGAVAVTPDADIQLLDCEFTGNSTDREGGAVRFLGTYLSQIQSSRFMDNYAGSGGAIYSGRGSLILSDCILTRNRANT